MSIVRAKLETPPLPKQGDPRVVLGAKKAREHWFKQVLDAVVRHVDFGTVKCLVLAGPGFTKDAFYEYADCR
jgi:protein pelota